MENKKEDRRDAEKMEDKKIEDKKIEDKISGRLKRFNYLCSEIEAVYHDMAQSVGLSDSAMVVLYILYDRGGSCSLREICRSAGISKQTINSCLRKLEEEGTLYLEAENGKAKKVCLTKEGQKLCLQTVRKIMEAEDEIYLSWTEEEINQYLDLTERYVNKLQEKSHILKQENLKEKLTK